MSIRPASPYVTTITSGYVKKSLLRSVKADLPLHRQMYPEMRSIEVSASSFPLGLAYGLLHYLETYPYGCTEQLVSQAFPAVVLGSRPEFGLSSDKSAKSIAHAIATLEARQNAEGAFGLWSAGGDVVPFVNVYATHFLLEAREHGFEVPPMLLASALNSLRAMTASPGSDIETYRADAYALYLLARSGVVVTDQANALRAALDQNDANAWTSDLTALYLASTYQLLKMDREASEIIRHAPAMPPADSAIRHLLRRPGLSRDVPLSDLEALSRSREENRPGSDSRDSRRDQRQSAEYDFVRVRAARARCLRANGRHALAFPGYVHSKNARSEIAAAWTLRMHNSHTPKCLPMRRASTSKATRTSRCSIN